MTPSRSLLVLLLLLMTLPLILVNCGGHSYDAWARFSKGSHEPIDFAAYTYVLFGKNLAVTPDDETELRYRKTLAAIIGFTSNLADSTFPPSETNLFAIPVTNLEESPDPLSNYDYVLSRELLDGIVGIEDMGRWARARLAHREGPFLLTATSRIRDMVDPGQCVLFADLSGLHPEAVHEAISRYRVLVAKEPEGCRRFEPLAVSLLNSMLHGNRFLSAIVKIDISGWFGLMSTESTQGGEDAKN